jgi:hypothetical protein
MKAQSKLYYLGALRGTGILSDGEEAGIQVEYDIDGFRSGSSAVIGSGEVRMAPLALQRMFGRKDLRLLTDQGRVLNLVFSDKELGSIADVAPVDVAGELPGLSEWDRESPRVDDAA